MIFDTINSKSDGLKLSIAIMEAKNPKGIVQISHGMQEHKERYFDFMEFLAKNGYTSIIHDHRGHGKSVKTELDLGYFYTDDINYIIDDLYDVTCYAKNKYKNLKVYLFSHSMGTLVSRCYIKKYDSEIEKLILCGPATRNSMDKLGIKLCSFMESKKYNRLLNKITFKNYNKGYKVKNSWICSNENVVKNYNLDPYCSYIFTTNGFLNLYKLMHNAYLKDDYKLNNKNLDIFVIAGVDDPVIQSEKKFMDLIHFLNEVGYKNIEYKLYPGCRHELLNEVNNKIVYNDILDFIGDMYESTKNS